MKTYMAIDQYGYTHHDLGTHPRKALLERLFATKAEKMYIDDNEGKAHHCGYIIKGLWLNLYEVQPFLREA